MIDLAAGTGQLARCFASRVAGVVAIEPVAGMREALARAVPEVLVREGRAEAVPLPRASADAVVIGEAFHWFDGARALTEIERVLRPAGGLALLWNVYEWQEKDLPWLPALRELLHLHRPAAVARSQAAGSSAWQEPFDRSDRFDPLRRASFRHVQRLTREGFLAQVASWSPFGTLEDAERAKLLTRVDDLIGEDLGPGRPLIIPFRTDLFWTQRRK